MSMATCLLGSGIKKRRFVLGLVSAITVVALWSIVPTQERARLPFADHEMQAVIDAGNMQGKIVTTNSLPVNGTNHLAVANVQRRSSRGVPSSRTRTSSCRGATPFTPQSSTAHFQQVQSYVGPVNISDIALQMSALTSADPTIPNTDGRLRVVFFALDGTLLNLMRWGQIVNDNDIDMGFYIAPTTTATLSHEWATLPLSSSKPLEHYELLQRWLHGSGLMGRDLEERDVRKLHNSKKALKPHTCKHRGQMMQCRINASPVILDWFGAETLEVPQLTDLVLSDFLPTAPCKSFETVFPCPAHPIRVLKQFTLNVASSGGAPVPHREFTGCALFPRRAAEQSQEHVRSIVAHGRWLRDCQYPNLLNELVPHSQWFERQCADVVQRSGSTS